MGVKRKERNEKRKRDKAKMERQHLENAVDDTWPMEEIKNMDPTKQSVDDLERNERKNKNELNKNQNQKWKKRRSDGDTFEPDDGHKFTAEDLLESAPVPVLDQKFDDVYDPFKDNLPNRR